ncbi:MAG TPA: polysaccharide deacetylase family protein [Gemmatimonadaceae bacterium]|nr:polysaccharide deacetylase family protein [Gemmatimonadaceae bacterium]
MLSHLYFSALRVTGVTALARRVRRGGVILCYHNVVAAPDRGGDPGAHMPVADFARQLAWLLDHHDVIPLGEFVRRVGDGASLRRTLALTFDDAYAGVFEHAWPLLRNKRVPATVFIPTDFIAGDEGFWWDHPAIVRIATPARRARWIGDLRGDGPVILREEGVLGPSGLAPSQRPATWETIRVAAAEGLSLGAHSATHRNLTRLSDAELHRETIESRDVIASHTGMRAESFAYPYGIWNQRTRDIVSQAGFSTAVALDNGLSAAGTDVMALRRVNIPASIPAAAFQGWLAGLRPISPRT